MKVVLVIFAAGMSLLAGAARSDAAYLKANPNVQEVSVPAAAIWVLRWSGYWFRTRMLPGAKSRRKVLADTHAAGNERDFNSQTIDAVGVLFTASAVTSAFAVAILTP